MWDHKCPVELFRIRSKSHISKLLISLENLNDLNFPDRFTLFSWVCCPKENSNESRTNDIFLKLLSTFPIMNSIVVSTDTTATRASADLLAGINSLLWHSPSLFLDHHLLLNSWIYSTSNGTLVISTDEENIRSEKRAFRHAGGCSRFYSKPPL